MQQTLRKYELLELEKQRKKLALEKFNQNFRYLLEQKIKEKQKEIEKQRFEDEERLRLLRLKHVQKKSKSKVL